MTEYEDTRALGQKGLKRLIQLIKSELFNKQDALVSGSNIKTVNGESLVGSGNVQVGEGLTYSLTKSGHNISLVGSDGTSQTVSDGYLATGLEYAQLTRRLTLTGENSSVTFPLASSSTPGLMTQTDKAKVDRTVYPVDGSVAVAASGYAQLENLRDLAPGIASRPASVENRLVLTEYGNLRLDYKNADSGEWTTYAYFEKSHYTHSGFSLSLDTAGYVTSSGTNVRFSIPLARHVDPSIERVELTRGLGTNEGFVLRQNGKYTHGSGPNAPVWPNSLTVNVRGDGWLEVVAVFNDTTNVTNNDAIGVAVSGTVTFY